MLFNILLSALASVPLTAASCDPRTATCQPIPAMPSSVTYNLSPTDTNDFSFVKPSGISASGSDLLFTVAQSGDNPTLVTNDYLLYGNVKATIKTAPGVGMVSAFILMSDVLDEIDYEWLGAYDNQVQTNYFYRGETANYDRGGVSTISTPEETTHVYEIDWTNTTLTWLVDGVAIRTLNKADTTGYGYPSTPCQIKIGVWASGDSSNSAGTIEWGGGAIDYTKGPYSMTLSSLQVTSYTTAKSFSYTGQGTNVVISQNAVAVSASSGTSSASAASQTVGGAIVDVKAAAASSGTAQTTSTKVVAAGTTSTRAAATSTMATQQRATTTASTGGGAAAIGGTASTATRSSATTSARASGTALSSTSAGVATRGASWVLATLVAIAMGLSLGQS